jgi:hypothetical protein
MSVNVYVITQRGGRPEDVVVGTSAQFKDWFVSQPKYNETADPEDTRALLDEEMNVKKDSLSITPFEIRVYPSVTVLAPTGGRRRRQTRKQKSRRL